MRKVSLFFKRAAAAVAATAVAASSHAQAVDISAAVTAAKTDIGVAGGLIIGVVVAVAAFSWIRRVIK
jgi:alkylhydroperoxidase family enzyme